MTRAARTKVVRRFTAELSCDLKPSEMLERGKSLAQIEQKIRDEADHADKVKRDLKSREAALISERSRLAAIVRDGREPRTTNCSGVAKYDEANGVYEEYREDTGEWIEGSRRSLSDAERQTALKLQPEPKEVTPDSLFETAEPEPPGAA